MVDSTLRAQDFCRTCRPSVVGRREHGPVAPSEPPVGLRESVREMCENLATLVDQGHVTVSPFDGTWCRDDDGQIRLRQRVRSEAVWAALVTRDDETTIPGWAAAVAALKSVPVVVQQTDRMIGTRRSAHRVEMADVVRSLVLAMQDDHGHLRFTDGVFEDQWSAIADVFDHDIVTYRQVAPIPGIHLDTLPLELQPGVELDRFTDREITRCFAVGVLNAPDRFPVLDEEFAIGLRVSTPEPKLVFTDPEEDLRVARAPELGTFGVRPSGSEHLLLADVLSALRLAVPDTEFWSPGSVGYADVWYGGFGGGFFSRPVSSTRWNFRPRPCPLDAAAVASLVSVWRDARACGLESSKGARSVMYALGRFNSALERTDTQDRLVDLMIAAEALLLSGKNDELSLRLAVRAASFAEGDGAARRSVYETMRTAYGLRSKVVHGGLVGEGALREVIRDVEDVIRAALRKALSDSVDRSRLTKDDYWDEIMLSLWSD